VVAPQPPPQTNSDEATMGLAALHISQGAGHPVFFYGQYYMGTLEAYAAAPLFRLFGPSVLVQRLPVLLSYALFLWLVYRLTRLVYRPWLATLVVGLLAFGGDRVVKDQLIAAGGYPELLPMGTGALLLAVLLGRRQVRYRLLGFAGWGLLAGLMIWDDWLILPYLLAATVLLVVGCGRELLGWPVLVTLVAAVAGASPLLEQNLADPGHNSLSAYLAVGGAKPEALADRVHGGVGLGVALAGGGCQPSHCGTASVAGSYGYVLLLVVAAALAVQALVRLRATARRVAPGGATGQPVVDRRAERVRMLAMLCLPSAALLTLALYVRNPSAAQTPIESSRYLSCLQISLGATLWPLWLLARRLFPSGEGATPARMAPRIAGAAAVALIAAMGVAMLAATVGVVRLAPEARADRHRTETLAATLRQMGVRDFYSEYWTCNKLTLAAAEYTVCATVRETTLEIGYNRYRPYVPRVEAAPDPAYVAPVGSALDATLTRYFADHHVTPSVTEVPGYRIYQANGRIGIPVG
jgi:hypothetical protein